MAQARDGPRLRGERLAKLGTRHLVMAAPGLQDLERDPPIERDLARPVDDGESALRDPLLDPETTVEDRPRRAQTRLPR